MSSQEILKKIKENIDNYEGFMQLRRELILKNQELTRSFEESKNNPDTSDIELAMKAISLHSLISMNDRHIHYINSEIVQMLDETSYFIELLKSENDNGN